MPMKSTTTAVLIVALCLCGSFLFSFIFSPFSDEKAEDAARLRVQVDALSREIDKLADEQRDLSGSVSALRSALEDGAALATRQPLESVAVEVDRWMRENRPDLVAADDSLNPIDAAGELTGGMNSERTAQLLAMLEDPDLSAEEWGAVWKKINDAGLMDDALAALKDAAEKDPTNPDAHMALAGGYLARTTFTDNDLEKGYWAIEADKSLDRTLELDPGHWDARFTKASSLTFYPPIMGRQGEAMKHFEVLLEQQKSLPSSPKHAQTYLYLGNLHQQMGNHQKASRVWRDGLSLFPQSAELTKQLENAMND